MDGGFDADAVQIDLFVFSFVSLFYLHTGQFVNMAPRGIAQLNQDGKY